jgi:hypothetical protein
MKRAIGFTCLLLLIAVAVAMACPGTVRCPIHDGYVAIFKSTKMIDGVFVGVYRCPRKHDVTVRCK